MLSNEQLYSINSVRGSAQFNMENGFAQGGTGVIANIGQLRGYSNGSGNSMAGSSFYSYIPIGQASGYSGSFAQ